MDRAPADSEGDDAPPAVVRSPSIGVPSIPGRTERRPTPSPVPSVAVPPSGANRTLPGPGPEPSVGTWAALEIDPVMQGGDEPAVGPGLGSAPTRTRPTVPVVSTRTMPLPVERGTPRPPPGDGGGTDPADRSSPFRPDPFESSFPPGVAAKLGWYVYLLTDPGSGKPFYVGRGRGDRCFRHLEAARTPTDPPGPETEPGEDPGDAGASAPDAAAVARARPDDGTDGAKGSFPALDQIREVEAREGPVRLEILRYELSAKESRLVRVSVVDLLGLGPDPEPGSRRLSAADLGTRLAKRAKFKRHHQVVLLRVGDRGADTAYERVRHDWRIGRRWTDPSASRSPRWAVIVAGELVVAVYAIDAWEPTPLPGPPGPSGESGPGAFTARSTYRHSFIGRRDDDLEAHYVGRSVGAYLGAGPGRGPVTGRVRGVGVHNQVTYVWCGPHWVNPVG